MVERERAGERESEKKGNGKLKSILFTYMSLVYEASLTVFCCCVDWGTFSAAIYVAVGALSYTGRLLACLCVSSEWRMFVNGGRISTH